MKRDVDWRWLAIPAYLWLLWLGLHFAWHDWHTSGSSHTNWKHVIESPGLPDPPNPTDILATALPYRKVPDGGKEWNSLVEPSSGKIR